MRAVESMLLVAPDPTSCLGGLIGPVGPIEAVDSNGISTESIGRIFYSNATGLEGLFRHLNRCCYGHRIPMHLEGLGSASTVDSHRSVGLVDRSGWISIDEVSFKIKDTLCSRDQSGSRTAWTLLLCVCTLKAIMFLPNRRFELFLVYVG